MTEPIKSEPVVSAEQYADYEELRSLLRPTESLRVLDDFSTWLFASAALVGTLGAGFGMSGLPDLEGAGRLTFTTAVACLAGSLACSALARTPRLVSVNRYAPDSLRAAIDRTVKTRHSLLVAAALLFSAAILLAGLSPLLS